MSFNTERPLPAQYTGAQSNTEAEKECAAVEAAKKLFQDAKKRLQTVGNWHQFSAGPSGTRFWLTDARGNEKKEAPQVGDHFKIDIPGPGSATGDGFDWVRIEDIIEEADGDCERLTIRVRPATNPTNSKEDVAHFFADEATSNFLVERMGNTVKAAVHGRNEMPNTSADAMLDKARNTAVAAGAITGFAKLQWRSLVNGLINDEVATENKK